MATHSSVLAWRIPGMGEPGGLPSIRSQSQTQLKRLSSSSSSRIRWKRKSNTTKNQYKIKMNLKKSDAPESCYPGSKKGSWQKKFR